jgi:glycosyltransferase involved in cell wall biosynthesis
MNRRPRVLAFGPLPPPTNGMSNAFGQVVRHLPARGWDVIPIDTADRTGPRAGSTFTLARAGNIGRLLVEAVARIRRADVVYVTIAQSRLGFAKDIVILESAALAGRPAVVHMHGGYFHGFYSSLTAPEKWCVTRTLDRVSSIIALTDSLRADFRMSRDWERRTVAISNTCDVPLGSERRLRPRALSILYISTLMSSKGYRETIAAASLLAQRHPAVHFQLDLGGELLPERDFPSRQAQEQDLRERLADAPANLAAKHHGVVTGSAKQRLLDEADVFVLPTDYVNEGQPIAVIEALTAGLPVVATAWRGIPESLPESMRSLLVPARDAKAVAEKLEDLLVAPDTFAAMSRDALGHASHFRPERHFDALDRELRRALTG